MRPDRSDGGALQHHFDVVPVHGPFDPHPHDTVTADPPALVVDAFAGAGERLHVGVRGPGDLSLAP